MLKKTAQFYKDNPASYKKKLKKDATHPKWGKQTRKAVIKRVESAKARRHARKRGVNIKGKHYDHKQKRFIKDTINMGQREASRLKGSKRNKKTFGKTIGEVLSKKK